MRGTQKTGLAIAAAALVASAACGNRGSSADADMARDLELAPRAGSQTVVSAIEAGPTAAPTHTAHKPAATPVSHPAPLHAAPQRSAPPPVAAVAQTPTAPREPAPATPQKSAEPAPLPPFPDAQGAGKARQRGTYSTEAEIFQRMPWIRP